MGKRVLTMVALLALAALLLVACGGNPAEEPGGGSDPGVSEPGPGDGDVGGGAPAGQRPPTMSGTIVLEGMPEPMEFVLFEAPATWPLPFSTYHTEDLLAETVALDGGNAVNFVANFAGTRNDAAIMHVFFHTADTTAAEAAQAVDALVEDFALTAVAEDDASLAWATAYYHDVESPGGVTWLATGEHDGQFFYVLADYPAEFGDGFAPRLHSILGEWQWSDTGEPLATHR